MTELVMQHHMIGYLVAEIPYGKGFISVVDTGGRIELGHGKTWPATREDLLENLHNDLWSVIAKYAALGVTSDDIKNALPDMIKEIENA